MTSTETEIGAGNPSLPVPCSVPVGWQCPRCGRVNAPWAMQCTCAAVTAPDQWPGEPRKWPTYTGDPLPGQEPTTVCSTPNEIIRRGNKPLPE